MRCPGRRAGKQSSWQGSLVYRAAESMWRVPVSGYPERECWWVVRLLEQQMSNRDHDGGGAQDRARSLMILNESDGLHCWELAMGTCIRWYWTEALVVGMVALDGVQSSREDAISTCPRRYWMRVLRSNITVMMEIIVRGRVVEIYSGKKSVDNYSCETPLSCILGVRVDIFY